MKPRYIDANVILPMLTNKANTMTDRHGIKAGDNWLLSYDDIKEVLDKIPTVNFKEEAIKKKPHGETIEPKRGKWSEHQDYVGDTYYTCSLCGEDWTTIEGEPMDNLMNYCPNCGARMNGGSK